MSDPVAGRPWPAPAKLNLMLRILGRRPDGYHRLQTVFQFLDRQDRLFFEPRDDGRIRRVSALAGVPEESDLVVRAARLLRERTGRRLGVGIRVEKRLPLGGGLGGGSSDAATTLVALNRLWETGLTEPELMALGAELGADVPIFVYGRAAWGEGIGEVLTPVEPPEPWYLVLAPRCRVATGAVFSDEKLTRDSAPITMKSFVVGDNRNDCLAVVRRRYPEVAAAWDWLATVGRPRLTGTGACVFCAFATAARAEVARSSVPSRFSAFVARGRNRSPLAAAARV
ncbi:MAG: 4-(cytidine 5'-diphospho)-2-C-methyl-D-erythritol kinase [Candidatus Thiosymbion ectosymbiont of Robbea hypermnestra]|nr:4-(cytidine 5'-diphospho)-2-C-methyl-D-erythritol kinase [Candidatus Thiosymbion ectosymbiont of Robbea hypermnestra]